MSEEELKLENESNLDKSVDNDSQISIPENMTREWWLKEGLKLLGKLRRGIN